MSIFPSISFANTFEPADGSTLIVIGQDKATIDKYIEATNQKPSGFMIYTSLNDLEGIAVSPIDLGAGINDPNYLLGKYQGKALQIGLYLKDMLSDTVQRKYDDQLTKLARWFKENNVPIFLRIGYEFDFAQNQYDPREYQAAYKYIVDFLRKEGVSNVAYVWHSYGVVNPVKPFTNWYPGDDYVDWIGTSFFNPDMDSLNIIAHYAQVHHKPLMIAEATPYGIGTKDADVAWDKWYSKLFDFIKQQNVKMLCYIDSNWDSLPMFSGQGFGDARIEANPKLQARWLNEIGKSKYLQSL